jgi:hypothetical protein
MTCCCLFRTQGAGGQATDLGSRCAVLMGSLLQDVHLRSAWPEPTEKCYPDPDFHSRRRTAGISADATWSGDERRTTTGVLLSVVFADILLRRWELDKYGGGCSAPFL